MNQITKIANNFIKKGHSVLELGCGNGDLINEIAESNNDLTRIVAVDYFNEPKNLNRKIEFIKQDIEKLNISGHFDIVIAHHVLEHIKDPLGLIEEIKKMLNENGRILITVPNRYGFGFGVLFIVLNFEF